VRHSDRLWTNARDEFPSEARQRVRAKKSREPLAVRPDTESHHLGLDGSDARPDDSRETLRK